MSVHTVPEGGEFDALGLAYMCILHVWRFKKFTEGRWTSVSSSCRTLLASLSLGLDAILEHVRGKESESDYYLHGYARFGEELRKAVCVASVAGWVVDQAISSLLEDDRVCLRCEALDELIRDELAFVGDISSDHFDRMGPFVSANQDSRSLQSDCIGAAWVSASFFTRQVLRIASEPPWALAIGDISLNLDRLASQDHRPVDLTTRKIQELARMRWHRPQLIEAVHLMKFLSWSTLSVEQGHSSATLMHRHHAEYSQDVLLCRALLHSCRNMLPDEREANKRKREEAFVERMQRKVPRRANGPGMLFKDLFALHSTKQDGAPVPQKVKQELMRAASKQWAALDVIQKDRYVARAHELAERREKELDQLNTAHMEQVRLRRRRVEEDALDDQGPVRLGTCRFNDDDLRIMDKMVASAVFSAENVAQFRRRAVEPPTGLSDAETALLSAVLPEPDLEKQPCPKWAVGIVDNRDHFTKSALCFLRPTGQTEWYAVMYAKQKPRVLTLAHMRCSKRVGGSRLSPGSEGLAPEWRFKLDGCFVAENDIDVEREPPHIFVLPALVFIGKSQAISNRDLVNLSDFTANLPVAARKSSGDKKSRPGARQGRFSAELLRLYPWLREYSDGTVAKEKSELASSSTAPPVVPERKRPPPEQLDAGTIADMFAELESRRDAVAQRRPAELTDFTTVVRGGKYTMHVAGVGGDCERAHAASAIAIEWCERYGLKKSFTAYYSVYTDAEASMLVLGWAHRMQGLFNMRLGRDPTTFVYTDTDVDSYIEGADFAAWVDLQVKPEVIARARQIRAIRPFAPKAS